MSGANEEAGAGLHMVAARWRSAHYTLFLVRVTGTMPRLLVQALFPQLMAAGAFGPQAAGLIMMGQSATAIAVIPLFPAIVRLVCPARWQTDMGKP